VLWEERGRRGYYHGQRFAQRAATARLTISTLRSRVRFVALPREILSRTSTGTVLPRLMLDTRFLSVF